MDLKWLPLTGNWKVENNTVHYYGSSDSGTLFPHGIIFCNKSFRDGSAQVNVKFLTWDKDAAARILLNFEPKTKEYISVDLGGYERAFVVSRYFPDFGWKALAAEGAWTTLIVGQEYDLKVIAKGQTVAVYVDGVKVIDHRLDEPLVGSQVGLYVWGTNEVTFQNFRAEPALPQGFVVMEFSETYEALYREVLLPVAQDLDILLRRADEIKGPGIILQDIVKDIAESTVVVAEITPPNPNVFYELGYSHALNKPTILLARRGEKLPFDIAGYRCIFYDDTIAGKSNVEREFRRHLEAILGK